MIDLIVFSVGTNKYAMNIENVQRIIQSQALTDIPNVHIYIDGMMSYEDKVIKVLNFRKLIGMKSYRQDLKELFVKLKEGHQTWIDELRHSVANGVEFTKTLDPHACELGKWLDTFNSYDEKVSERLRDLNSNHKHLHKSGGVALETYKSDEESAKKIVNTDMYDTFKNTMGSIDGFVSELDLMASSLQKLIIYDNDGVIFGIKVDTIEDIAHVQKDNLVNANETSVTDNESDFLELEGVLDLEGSLINIIKTINLPK